MPSQERLPPLISGPEGRGGGSGASAGVGAGGWDDPADHFAGGMAYVPRRPRPEPEPEPEPPAAPSTSAAPDGGDAAADVATGAPAVPHGPTREPHPAGRRRRRSRRHRARKRMGPIMVVAGIVAVIGAIIGVGGGFGMVWLMRDSPLASVMSPEEEAERATFISACAPSLPSVDCGCLWDDARPAFTPDYRAAVLRLIDERRDLPVRLQRIRSEKLLGPELAKTVWEAVYHCTQG